MPERFSASNAAKHMACHASANLEKAIPNWTPPVIDLTAPSASRRGTDMHENLDKFAELPAKDIQAAGRALSYVGNVRARRRFKVLHEVSMDATWLTVPTQTTVDLCFYVAEEIHVIDYKTGKIPVSVHNNDQLKFYAVTLAPLAPKAEGVHLHIVQPWLKGGMRPTPRPTSQLTSSCCSRTRRSLHRTPSSAGPPPSVLRTTASSALRTRTRVAPRVSRCVPR